MSMPVKLHLLRAGTCRHLECVAARGGRLALVEFPALCGLIRHPARGWILFDTGYSSHFFEATSSWPEKLYRTMLPVDLPPSEHLTAQLRQFGIRPADISTVIISHYHGDHIAGLRDFPGADFIALLADTHALQALQGRRWRATLNGQLPGLLPENFFSRLHHADDFPSRALPSWMAPFNTGFDLLGDGSLLGIPLPGHSRGQLGLLLPGAEGGPTFLVGDACWSLPACREGRLPSRLALFTTTADRQRYQHTFFSLGTLSQREPAVALLPSHCNHAWEEFRNGR